MPDVPGHRGREAGVEIVGGRVAEQARRLADVGLRVADVAGPELAIARRVAGGLRRVRHEAGLQLVVERVERRPSADRDVVDLVQARVAAGGGGQQVGLDRVVDVAEVARRLAVAVDRDRRVGEQRGDPLRDHGRVRAVRVLALAEHVEVAQADRREPVAAREDVRVQLVDVLGDRVRRQRPADVLLDLRQRRMVAVGRTRRGVDEALDPRVAGGHQHVEEAVDVGRVGRDRVLERARHGAERRLVEDEVDALAGSRAVGEAGDVALDHREAGRAFRPDGREQLVDVAMVLRPGPKLDTVARLNFAACLAGARMVHELTGLECHTKWPNDILLRGHKIGGILSEADVQNGHLNFVVVGLGLNVNHEADDLPSRVLYPASSLLLETKHTWPIPAVREAWLHDFEVFYNQLLRGEWSHLRAEFWRRCAQRGQVVTVQSETGTLTGTATALDFDGALLIENESGRHRAIAGDILL